MRVIITSGIHVEGGSSIVVENLAHQLCNKGYDITIGALRFERTPPMDSYHVIKLPIHNLSKQRRLLNGFDIVHNNHPLTNYLALLCRKPFVYHCHGAPNVGLGYLYQLNLLASVKLMSRAFDAVVAVSYSGAAELKRYCKFKRLAVVYNGVDTDRFKEGLEERFRRGTPQFLFVGSLSEHKNLQEIVIALKELVRTWPKVHLQIVGRGHMYRRTKRLVAELNMERNVNLVGYVTHQNLPYYYSSCDVYVTASRSEVFDLPVLEAMACGKPVVASSIPAHAEIISKSKAGITYTCGDVGDLSKKMIETYEERDRYRNNGLRFAKRHSWSETAERMLKIYAEVKNLHQAGSLD